MYSSMRTWGLPWASIFSNKCFSKLTGLKLNQDDFGGRALIFGYSRLVLFFVSFKHNLNVFYLGMYLLNYASIFFEESVSQIYEKEIKWKNQVTC